MKARDLIPLATLLALPLFGCGGARLEAASPNSPARAPASDAPGIAAEAAPAGAAPAASPPPPQAAPSPVTVAAPKAESSAQKVGREDVGAASAEVSRARDLLRSAAGDCATACRALGSMERATAHLCALASSPDDQRACADARGFVYGGRDKVRASCGDCPGGPSLDRGAPIPSAR